MADPKDKEAPGARRAPNAQPAAPDAAPHGGDGAAADNTVGTRETQYIIGPRVVPGSLTPLAAPSALSDVLEKFKDLPGYKEVRRLKTRGVGLFATGSGGAEIAVASTSPELGKELEAASRAGAPFVAERNRVLNHHGLAPARAGGADATAAAALPGSFELGQISFDFSVVGADNQPLEGRADHAHRQEVPGPGRHRPERAGHRRRVRRTAEHDPFALRQAAGEPLGTLHRAPGAQRLRPQHDRAATLVRHVPQLPDAADAGLGQELMGSPSSRGT
jgi:hypothetical protein